MSAGTTTVTTTGPGPWMLVNLNAFNEGVGLLVTLSTGGTMTCNVEVTGDNPRNPGFGTHVNLHDVLQGLTASKNSSLAYPCTALRLNPSALSAGASVTLAVVQSVD